MLNETVSGEPMNLKVVTKTDEKSKFLYRENSFSIPELLRMLCNQCPHTITF